MSEDKQCDGCYWRWPDWRDGGWCYMFKERFEGCAQWVGSPLAALDPVRFGPVEAWGPRQSMAEQISDEAEVIGYLNECDRENDPPSAREIGDGDYPDDRYDR